MREILIKPSEVPVPKEVSAKRKALFKKHRSMFSAHITNKDRFNAVMRFFVTGEETISREVNATGEIVEKSLVGGSIKSMFHPAMSREYAQEKMREDPSFKSFGSAREISGVMHYLAGVLEEDECKVLHNLLPEKYDHEEFIQESREKRYADRYMPSPIEIMSIFTSQAVQFLTFQYPFSQYSRVQWLVEFWRQTLPYFNVEDFEPVDGKTHYHLSGINKIVTLSRLENLMGLVRFFIDPSYLQGTDSPFKRFRDEVADTFEKGTNNELIDSLWQKSARSATIIKTEERVQRDTFLVFSESSFVQIVERINSYLFDKKCTEQGFSESAIALINVKPFFQIIAAYLYGYLDEKKYKRKLQNSSWLTGVDVPAKLYRLPIAIELPDALNASYEFDFLLIHIIRSPSADANSMLPCCFVVLDTSRYNFDPDILHDVYKGALKQLGMRMRMDLSIDIRFIQGCALELKTAHKMTAIQYGDLAVTETRVACMANGIPYITTFPAWKGALPSMTEEPKPS